MCLGELSWVKFSVRHFILHELRSTYWPKRYKAKLVLRLKLLGWKVKYNSLLTIDLLSKKGIKLIKRIEFVTRRMTTLYTYLKCAFAMALLFCFLGIHIEKWRANSPLSLLSILKNRRKYFNLVTCNLEWSLWLSLSFIGIFKINDAFMARMFLLFNPLVMQEAKPDDIFFHK